MASNEAELEQAIAAARQRVEDKRTALDEARADVMAKVGQWYKNWIMADAKTAVRSYPEQAKSLGKDGVAAFRAEAERFAGEAPLRLHSLLEKDTLVFRELASTQDGVATKTVHDRVLDVIDRVNVAWRQIVMSSGLSQYANRAWDEWASQPRRRQSGEFTPRFDEEVGVAIGQYERVYAEWVRAVSEQRGAQKAKAEYDADQLWGDD